MARTKQTARREGKGPGLAKAASSKASSQRIEKPLGSKTSKSSKKGKPMHMLERANKEKKRRIAHNIRSLWEIRKAMNALDQAIPRAPFQRLIRQICDTWKSDARWERTAILCLQEAAEDYLVEYFQDSMLMAAHAHRVTIMNKDMETLKRVRWRYDKLLHPTDWVDIKMRDILLVPPTRKAAQASIKIQEVTHERDTRAKRAYEESLKEQRADTAKQLQWKHLSSKSG